MAAPALAPRTYWAWRTVRDHGPLTSAEVHEHMPGMTLERVAMSLYNMVTAGYLRSIKRPGQRSRLFEVTDRVPDDLAALEQQLQADPVFLRLQVQMPSERTCPGPSRRRRKPGEAMEPAAEPFVPAQPEAPHHNHWVSAGAAWPPRPPVVRPGSLDARRLPSLQFGQPRQGADVALGVVEAGTRHA